MQNQSPQLRHLDLVLNLLRCIGASAAAEDDSEELNQHSPALLKKTRPSCSSEPADGVVLLKSSNDAPAASHGIQGGGSAALDWPVDAEVYGTSEIAEMAALLLRMILELCGEQLSAQRSVSNILS